MYFVSLWNSPFPIMFGGILFNSDVSLALNISLPIFEIVKLFLYDLITFCCHPKQIFYMNWNKELNNLFKEEVQGVCSFLPISTKP